MKYLTTLAFTLVLALSSAVFAQSEGTPWGAADSLGRIVQSSNASTQVRANKSVGMFYFLWVDETVAKCHWCDGPYDVSKILAKLPPEDLKDTEASKSDLWAPGHAMYFWSEPLYGYYNNKDPWVIRRHLQLLADAGVDFLVFDTTNYVTYPATVAAICNVMKQIRAEGGRTPQITFMLNTETDKTAAKLWKEVYGTGKYDELLFQLDGKPLMIGDPNAITDPTIKEKLTLRRAHWPFEMVNTQNAWHWEAAYPQPYGWSIDENTPEQVNVSVAQNLSREPKSPVKFMSSGMARGRSFCNGKIEEDLATDEGRNFAEQWKRAYELDPPYVMITGWNEWIAGRWDYGDGRGVFVDQYNREYSRDIEPMKGGHLDAYYLQAVDGIRKYKGAPALPKFTAKKTIDLNGGFEQWQDVDLTFADWRNETVKRDFSGAGQTHYVNETGRNDFIEFKATRDDKNFYFYAKTNEDIKADALDGLCLLLNVDKNLNSGFVGGDVLIGAKYDGTKASLAKFEGDKIEDWSWKDSGAVAYKAEKNEIMFAVSFDALGLTTSATFNDLEFKWLDNFVGEIKVEDLYTTGDVAPESRFFFNAAE